MLIAAAAAKSTEMKKIVTQTTLISPVPSRPSSPHGITNNIASSQKSSICRLQAGNFPIMIFRDDILKQFCLLCHLPFNNCTVLF